MNAVWYKKTFELPSTWKQGKTLLHIGACDYETEVWVNGTLAGTHIGGYTPFSLDITKHLEAMNAIVICAKDDVRSANQPAGKQSAQYASHGCMYTRTTGIWQTVWLEHVPVALYQTGKVYSGYRYGDIIYRSRMRMFRRNDAFRRIFL